MQAIVLQQPGTFQIVDTAEPPSPGRGEAVVRVHRIGICGTDYHAYRGRQPFFKYPRIVGHELGVTVEDVAANDLGIRPGDRCAVEPYLNCGACIACRRGKPNCCTDLKVLGVHVDGGMQPLLTVPVAKLHKSESLTLDQLSLVEMLGIGAHAVDRAALTAGENVLVIGVGPIGLTAIQFAKIAGAAVVAMDVNEERLRFCREQLGAAHTLCAPEDPVAALQDLLDGDLPTAVFDATGNTASMTKAFDYVAPGGRLVLIGLTQGEIMFRDAETHRRELTLLRSRNSTPEDFRRIVRLMEDGRINTTPWITHRAPFDQMIEQFPQWLQPESGVIKAIVEV